MPRPRSEYLRADLKVSLPAALVAEVNLLLEDPLTHRRKYGALSRLIEALLKDWLVVQHGQGELATIPTLQELRDA